METRDAAWAAAGAAVTKVVDAVLDRIRRQGQLRDAAAAVATEIAANVHALHAGVWQAEPGQQLYRTSFAGHRRSLLRLPAQVRTAVEVAYGQIANLSPRITDPAAMGMGTVRAARRLEDALRLAGAELEEWLRAQGRPPGAVLPPTITARVDLDTLLEELGEYDQVTLLEFLDAWDRGDRPRVATYEGPAGLAVWEAEVSEGLRVFLAAPTGSVEVLVVVSLADSLIGLPTPCGPVHLAQCRLADAGATSGHGPDAVR